LFASLNLFLSSLNIPSLGQPTTQSWIQEESDPIGGAAPDTRIMSTGIRNQKNADHSTRPLLIVATRFHLGKASVPPTQADLEAKLRNFGRFCSESCAADAEENARVLGVVAVDAEERIPGYSLVSHIRAACEHVVASSSTTKSRLPQLHVLPVQPWGQFAPALNALVAWACAAAADARSSSNNNNNNNNNPPAPPCAAQILFASAETTASAAAVRALREQLTPDDDALVAGIVLPGHDYRGKGTKDDEVVETALNGRTTPWNTLALWDLRKLALTGFQLVSEGLVMPDHAVDDDVAPGMNIAGVEEVVAIAVLQKLLGRERAKAKLVQMADGGGVEWDQTFGGDPARQEWHARKMESKLSRAARQMELLGLTEGVVHHC